MHAASGSGISSVHACVFLFALPPSSTMPEKLISDASRQSLVTWNTRVTYIASVM